LVFANNTKSKWANGEIIYYPYKKHPWHPCPTPKELTNFILMKYFKKNDRVLDPFMGTGAVGKEALQRGAKSFIGIEIDKSIYEKTKKDFDITFNNH
jgi:DNA modification methylase